MDVLLTYVTVSSIALNRSPEFPFTGLGLYWHKQNNMVLAEVSGTTLTNSHSRTDDYIPHTIKCKL